jgi:hypothetical protein
MRSVNDATGLAFDGANLLYRDNQQRLQIVTQPPIKRHKQRPGKDVHCVHCFSVPRWQCLTLPDPSQRWDLHPEPNGSGFFLFFSHGNRAIALGGKVDGGTGQSHE